MKTTHLLQRMALGALALCALGARADDIDIYQGIQGGAAPNLLIILDNAAAADGNASFTCNAYSLSNKDQGKNFGFETCGLYMAIDAIGKSPLLKGNINLGLMDFPTSGTNGGTFVLPKPTPAPSALVNMDSSGVSQMLNRISQLSLATDKSNNNQIAQALQESWAFYQGKTGLSGTTYPGVTATNCAKNFILYITLATNNQKPQDSGNVGGNALKSAEQLSAMPAQFTLPSYASPIGSKATASGKYQSDYSDEWSNFMFTGKSTDNTVNLAYPPITTYTIILSDGSNPDYEQLMVNMAYQGGGTPFVVQLGDLSGLADALSKIFYEVQATNSVFAAPVLPVSANTQGTYLNQVYIGMFRPAADDSPRWMGNLKQYQFGVDTSNPQSPQLFLADASWPPAGSTFSAGTNANRALSAAGTGFITPTAVSFWTSKDIAALPDSKGGFYANSYQLQNANDGYDLPDGQIVEKGGVSQRIRQKYLTEGYTSTSRSTRNLYTCLGTCTGGTSLSSMKFDTSNSALTATTLGLPTGSTIDPAQLIKWVRGEDTRAQLSDTNAGREAGTPADSSITVRGSVHGDVLHSRPAVINYGGSTGVVVFYGSNDGVFRAVNGNQPNNTTDSSKPFGTCKISSTCSIATTDAAGQSLNVPPGGELWGFVAQEFYTGLQRVYQNSPALKLAGMPTGVPKTYFFDGTPGVYQNASTGEAILFLSARRGGRFIYALDVSNPVDPKFKWKLSATDPGMGELGQTWSQPKVARIAGYPDPVLIFGAGYDVNEDAEPASADTMGRGIFIVNAKTGKVIWEAIGTGATCAPSPAVCKQLTDMAYAIPADVALIDRNFDGLIDRLYAADTGGNIWRVDLDPTGSALSTNSFDASNVRVTLLAALGGSGSTKRKFFFPPDVVLAKTYDVVLAVTGDREHPLLTQGAASIVNRFYMIRDTNPGMTSASWTTVRDDTSSTGNVAPAGLFNASSTPYDGTGRGFYVTLGNAAEKGVNAPSTVGGITYFGTNQPITASATSCNPNLGTARGYAIDFITGAKTVTTFDGGGLLPSPVSGIVTVNINGHDQQVPFLIGGGGGSGGDGRSGLGAQRPNIPVKNNKKRTYWYRDVDR